MTNNNTAEFTVSNGTCKLATYRTDEQFDIQKIIVMAAGRASNASRGALEVEKVEAAIATLEIGEKFTVGNSVANVVRTA